MEKHILIADDDSEIRNSIGIALRMAGYKISEAANGESALSLILNSQNNGNQFNLLILDIWMPEMNGIELLEELDKNGIFIPILAISAYFNSAVVNELMNKGFPDFLDKPFGPQKMIERIEDILRKFRKPKGVFLWE